MPDKIIILKDKINSARLMLKQVPRDRIIIVSVILVFVCLLIYHSLALIQERNLKSMSIQFSSQKKRLDYYTQIIKHADLLEKQLVEAEKKYETAKSEFLEEEELSVYFDDIRRQAQARRLVVLALDFSPQPKAAEAGSSAFAFHKRNAINISLRGNYYDVISFLHHLEYENPKIFDIDSAQIRRSIEADEIFLDIKGAIYVLIANKQAR